jgi:hypothetical protein
MNEITLNEVAAAVKNITNTRSISSGFAINLTTIHLLKVAGLLATQENIDKVHKFMEEM